MSTQIAASRVGALAVVATASIAISILVSRPYLVTSCFSSPTRSGCSTVVRPFSAEAVPALLGPAAFFIALTLLAVLAWRTPSTPVGAISTAGFAALACGAIVVAAPLLCLPLVLLVLAFLLRTGWSARPAVTDIAIWTSLTVLAFASGYTLLFAATLWRGAWVGGVAPAMWFSLAAAAAAAVGGGCALAIRPERGPFPVARAALWTYLICGVAGLAGLAVLLLLGGANYKAAVVTLAFVTAAVAISFGAVVLRFVFRFTLNQALAVSLAATLAFPLCVGIAVALSSTTGSSVGPQLPHVPWLPGTSTSR